MARAMPTPDVLGVKDTEGGLGERLRDGQLVHLFVVALLQVDDLALGGAALTRIIGKHIGGKAIGQRGQPNVEESQGRTPSGRCQAFAS